MKLQISRSIAHFNFGLLGRCFLSQLGFIDAFVINNTWGVLVKQDHASIKHLDKKKIPIAVVRQIAHEVLKYDKFSIESHKEGRFYIIQKTGAQNE